MEMVLKFVTLETNVQYQQLYFLRTISNDNSVVYKKNKLKRQRNEQIPN